MIVLDTETTGLNEDDRVIELAIAEVKPVPNEYYPNNLRIVEAKDAYFSTNKSIDLMAMSIHHITPEMLEDKPAFKESDIYKAYNGFDGIVVGHNVQFDLDMLKKDGFILKGPILDTYKCAQHLIHGVKGHYSLQYLRYALGLYKVEKEVYDAHNALGDVDVTINLLAYLLDKVNNNLDELIMLTKKPVLLEVCHFRKHKGERWSDIFRTDPGYMCWILNSIENLSADLQYTLKYYLDSEDLPC